MTLGPPLKAGVRDEWVGILLNSQAAEVTWDLLEITMNLVKGSNWLLRSGVMCVHVITKD